MLHKCANPTCTVPFRSLHEGKLFLAETFPTNFSSDFDGNRRKLRRREHFWLCDACSSHYTLRFDAQLGMLTVPLVERYPISRHLREREHTMARAAGQAI